jgi:hypothetical protein
MPRAETDQKLFFAGLMQKAFFESAASLKDG